MKRTIVSVFFLVITVLCSAQPYGDGSFRKNFKNAQDFVYDDSYLEAIPLLEGMHAFDTTNANLNYFLGVCYLYGKENNDLAIKWLERASENVSLEYREGSWKERSAPGLTYLHLGKAYHLKHVFDKAVVNYYNYRSFIETDDVETYDAVRLEIQYAENATDLLAHPVNVKITNLGSDINTEYPEYCPAISADGQVMIFTSRRPGGMSKNKDQRGFFYEDIYLCERTSNGTWGKPQIMGESINTNGHEAAIGISPDGQTLFIYKDDNNNGNIYQSQKTKEGWSKPVKLGSDINTSAWETHASVTATGDMLVFVSDREEGGYGGRDLWYCKRLPNNEWGLAQNMGSLFNSRYEEDSPFISADGKTLIFSSQGHTSMGGFDIFRSEFVDGVWEEPVNIGYPINTSEDDVFFTLRPDGKTAYYSSKRTEGYGETDLYKLELEETPVKEIAVAKGELLFPIYDYQKAEAKIVVRPLNGTAIGTYRPNTATGIYVLILTAGEKYDVTYEVDGYAPVTKQIAISKDQMFDANKDVVALDRVIFGAEIVERQQKEKERLEREAAKANAQSQKVVVDNSPAVSNEIEKVSPSQEEKIKAQEEKDLLAKQAEENRKEKEKQLELQRIEAEKKAAEAERKRKAETAYKLAEEARIAAEAAEIQAKEEMLQQKRLQEEQAKAQQEEQAKAQQEEQLKLEREAEAKRVRLAEELVDVVDSVSVATAASDSEIKIDTLPKVKEEAPELAESKVEEKLSPIELRRRELRARIEELKKLKQEKLENQVNPAPSTEPAKEVVPENSSSNQNSDKVEATENEKLKEAEVEELTEEGSQQLSESKGEIRELDQGETERPEVEQPEVEQVLAEELEEEKDLLAKQAEENRREEEKQLEQKRIEAEKKAAEADRKRKAEAAETQAKEEMLQQKRLQEEQAKAQQEEQLKLEREAEAERVRLAEESEAAKSIEEEILVNTVEELKRLNQSLLAENVDLKKQLVELNKKLNEVLEKSADNGNSDSSPEKFEAGESATLSNLKSGKRLVLRNIFFDYNRAELRSQSKNELNKVYDFLIANPEVKILVSGHTDSRGDDEYNLRLSQWRAESVVNYLVKNGIAQDRLSAKGYGETRPIARNENSDGTDNAEGRQLNRRIEISLPEGNENEVKVERIVVPIGSRLDFK
ncbi:OmpA family protein [Bacteroidota bacterium]